MNLKLETNPRNALDLCLHLPSGAVLMMTSPKPDECWLFRVVLSKKLALVAVPEFGGVSFSFHPAQAAPFLIPSECGAADILHAIPSDVKQHMPHAHWLHAIQLLQDAVQRWRRGTPARPARQRANCR